MCDFHSPLYEFLTKPPSFTHSSVHHQVIVLSASVSSQASTLAAINSNINSRTAHYTDGWRTNFSRHSSSRQWASGNITSTVPNRERPSGAEPRRLKRASGKEALATRVQ
ncbi:hypothetical protein ILYODFUR_024549 [Ilyodon furcidens]|uniref:Uncharacterized protein n=1 Tax=Ilyodon furcidens TaxID=33524 RepID=A0ABV0ULN2_9TELE